MQRTVFILAVENVFRDIFLFNWFDIISEALSTFYPAKSADVFFGVILKFVKYLFSAHNIIALCLFKHGEFTNFV
jgi:hypothetical protein